MFELSVVRDNQSVTSCECHGAPTVRHNVLGKHMYDFSKVKSLSCPVVEFLLFVLG